MTQLKTIKFACRNALSVFRGERFRKLDTTVHQSGTLALASLASALGRQNRNAGTRFPARSGFKKFVNGRLKWTLPRYPSPFAAAKLTQN
jgi:hypothetical protein